MFELENITAGIGKFDFSESGCGRVFELDNITARFGELDFFGNIKFV
jgi:hypothetical protein